MKQQAKIVAENVLSSYPKLKEGAYLLQCLVQMGLDPKTEAHVLFKKLDSDKYPNVTTLIKYRLDFIKTNKA